MLTQVMHGSNSRVAHLFCCLPTTFVLPKESTTFTEAFHKAAYGVESSVTQPKGLNLWYVTLHAVITTITNTHSSHPDARVYAVCFADNVLAPVQAAVCVIGCVCCI